MAAAYGFDITGWPAPRRKRFSGCIGYPRA
jgi:hypothetical protein